MTLLHRRITVLPTVPDFQAAEFRERPAADARLNRKPSLGSRFRDPGNQAINCTRTDPAPVGSHRPSDRSGRYSFTRSEGDRFQVRAKVRTPLAAPVEENSGLAVGAWHCDEAAAHNPQTGPHPEAAARSQEVAARSQGVAARPPLASTYGHVDPDSSRAGMRAAQPLQVHLEHNSHKAHDESRRHSLQPRESHQI